MAENNVDKAIGTGKDVANTLVIAYVGIVAARKASKLLSDFWNWKTETNRSKV